jgi:hypothetical protein
LAHSGSGLERFVTRATEWNGSALISDTGSAVRAMVRVYGRGRLSRFGSRGPGDFKPSPPTVHVTATSTMQARMNAQGAYPGYTVTEIMEQAFEQAGEVVVAGESCEVDPATGKRGC